MLDNTLDILNMTHSNLLTKSSKLPGLQKKNFSVAAVVFWDAICIHLPSLVLKWLFLWAGRKAHSIAWSIFWDPGNWTGIIRARPRLFLGALSSRLQTFGRTAPSTTMPRNTKSVHFCDSSAPCNHWMPQPAIFSSTQSMVMSNPVLAFSHFQHFPTTSFRSKNSTEKWRLVHMKASHFRTILLLGLLGSFTSSRLSVGLWAQTTLQPTSSIFWAAFLIFLVKLPTSQHWSTMHKGSWWQPLHAPTGLYLVEMDERRSPLLAASPFMAYDSYTNLSLLLSWSNNCIFLWTFGSAKPLCCIIWLLPSRGLWVLLVRPQIFSKRQRDH